MLAQRRRWGERWEGGVLRCWWGGGGALLAVRDDGGGGFAIALLGRRRFEGIRAVADVGQQVWCCQGGRAAVTESTTTTRAVNNTTRG
jgi:hypothetical protein